MEFKEFKLVNNWENYTFFAGSDKITPKVKSLFIQFPDGESEEYTLEWYKKNTQVSDMGHQYNQTTDDAQFVIANVHGIAIHMTLSELAKYPLVKVTIPLNWA